MTADESSPFQEPADSGAAMDFSEDIPQPPETVEPLSPFDGGGSFRTDDSWLNSLSKRSSGTKKKKAVGFG